MKKIHATVLLVSFLLMLSLLHIDRSVDVAGAVDSEQSKAQSNIEIIIEFRLRFPWPFSMDQKL